MEQMQAAIERYNSGRILRDERLPMEIRIPMAENLREIIHLKDPTADLNEGDAVLEQVRRVGRAATAKLGAWGGVTVKCNLAGFMESRRLTEFKLSKLCGVCQTTINVYKKAKRIPGLINALRVAGALRVRVEDIWKIA